MAVTKTQQGLTRSLLLAPAALWIIGFFILPYLLLAYMSFKPTSSTGPYLPGFTLENYIFNLTDPFYWEIMFETVAQGVLTVVICLSFRPCWWAWLSAVTAGWFCWPTKG